MLIKIFISLDALRARHVADVIFFSASLFLIRSIQQQQYTLIYLNLRSKMNAI